MKSCKVQIKGISWEMRIISKGKYAVLHGLESEAVTMNNKKVIEYREDLFCEKTCIHELFHAYVNECHLQSVDDLNKEDFEEIIAEMLEQHIDNIRLSAKRVYKLLKPKERKK